MHPLKFTRVQEARDPLACLFWNILWAALKGAGGREHVWQVLEGNVDSGLRANSRLLEDALSFNWGGEEQDVLFISGWEKSSLFHLFNLGENSKIRSPYDVHTIRLIKVIKSVEFVISTFNLKSMFYTVLIKTSNTIPIKSIKEDQIASWDYEKKKGRVCIKEDCFYF